MKTRLLAILFLLCAPLAHAVDLVISNYARIGIFGDSYMQSDGSAGMVTGYRFPDYWDSYIQLKNPGSNIHVFNISGSGKTMQNFKTNTLQACGLALWAYQFNNYQHIGIQQPTDNGSDSSNSMYLALSNIFQAPLWMSDGQDTLVQQTRWSSTNHFQWIALGDPPGASSDGGFTGIKPRNDGATNAGINFGVRGLDAFNTMSNAVVSDYNTNSGANDQFVYPNAIPHFLSALALYWFDISRSQIDSETNISTASVDYGGTVNGTNHSCIVSVVRSGSVLTFTRHDDRLPGSFDVPDGVITNDARPAFILDPQIPNRNLFTLKVTGLPTGLYTVMIDDQISAMSISSAELGSANGWNMYTNYAGPYWAQRKEVLGRIRDKEHVDRVTLAPLSVDGHGMFSYFSAVGTPWSAGLRGDALISSTLTNNVADIEALDALTATAATPTNHVFKIIPYTVVNAVTIHFGG